MQHIKITTCTKYLIEHIPTYILFSHTFLRKYSTYNIACIFTNFTLKIVTVILETELQKSPKSMIKPPTGFHSSLG